MKSTGSKLLEDWQVCHHARNIELRYATRRWDNGRCLHPAWCLGQNHSQDMVHKKSESAFQGQAVFGEWIFQNWNIVEVMYKSKKSKKSKLSKL